MKKTLKKQAALVMLSAAVTVQTGFPGYAAATVTGSWKNENGAWKFYSPDQKSFTGWVKTTSGWYYLNPEDGKMVTGWQKIDGFWYYFDTAEEGIEGRMHTGWYKNPENKWFFFDNGSGTANEGHMVIGWHWIDGYCYYFATESADQPGVHGAMYAGTTTPDGYATNADGQWLQDEKPVYRNGVGYNTKTASSRNSNSSGSGSGSGSGSSNSGKDNSSDSKDDSDHTTDDKEEYQYLLMNIPYADFYAAEIEGNSTDVDAVTSATKSKPTAGNLVGGSYHVNSDGSDISGVIFPVKIKKGTDLSKFTQVTDEDSFTITVTLRGTPVTSTYTGKDALFERPDYSYYVLSETPSYYKEVSVDADGNLSFGKAEGTATNVEGVSATLSTSSQYGDYQLGFTGMPDISSQKVLGIVLHTTEGEDFGLRHLENIWQRTQLAWSVGFTTQTHGNTLSYEHYKDMMGKHLNSVTYYTSEGILEIPFTDSVYVPVKLAAALSIENAAANAGTAGTAVTGVEFPSDLDLEYQVKNALGEAVAVQYDKESGKLTWEGSLTAGSYTLTVTDKSGKYAPVSGTFTLETESIPAAFTETEDGWKVSKAEDASDEEFKAYLAAISKVKVGENEYSASGRGAVKIIDATTGEIDFTAKSNNQAIFTIGEQYTLEVTATGYKNNLTGTVTATEKKSQVDALEGEATVETTDGKAVDGSYQAKVSVTVDADGRIVSVKDNGTEPGTGNSTYWNNATNMFVKLAGKTADEIDSVDVVSNATVSSNAIKKAVKNALSKKDATDEYQYLLMNIPYADFYAAEVKGNDVEVDAVSSATKNKTRNIKLARGSYHTDPNGTDISGVIYPVRVAKGTDLSKFKQITDSDSVTITTTNGETKYSGKDALFESEDYSYYILAAEPEYYKDLTVDGDTLTFGEAQSDLSDEAEVRATLQTESGFGDYQLSFEGLSSVITDEDQVYGVVLHTKEDVDYGLRHLENIWLRTNLAWSTGIVTTSSHGGSPLAWDHYESMMGKTITGLTYYTNNGIADITLDQELYVPYKFTHKDFGVKTASVSAGTTAITGLDSLPEDFDATYTFTDPSGKNTEAFTVDDSTEAITWSGSLAGGTYTLTVTDESGTYADLVVTFVLSADEIPVQATATNEGVWSLTAADDATEEEVASYLASITSVSVNGTPYAASGRGSVQIIDPNTGRIKTEVKSGETDIFTTGETYTIEVTATGYNNKLTFTMVAGEAPKPEGVEVEGTVSKDTTGFTVNGSYQAKLRVVVNEDGTVASVTDNGTEPGANSYWWNTATAIFKSLIGKNKNQIDAVDKISGATASSRVIKNAVKSALPDVDEQKPKTPTLTAADFRTKLLYAATEAAELSVEAEDGTVVKYTVDGSDPTLESSSVKTAENGVLTVEPTANVTAAVTVKAVAVKDGVASEIAEKELQFIEIPDAQSGLKVYQGSATVSTPSGSPYTAKLKVTVSEGRIVKVEDNGTETKDIRDAAFWTPYLFSENEEGISDRFAGKNLVGMLNAKTVPEASEELRVDAITGATVSSDAAKYAVIDALRSEPVDESDETVVAPEVSASWGSLVARVSNGIRLSVSAADNTTVYYTTDGSDPTQEDETLFYGGATIYANNSKSGKVKVKFAAFDENDNRSKIVSVWCVFTDEVPEVLYQTGTYEGSAGDVEATVTVERGYGSRPIISTIELDEFFEEEYANFLPELIAEITFKQSTKISPIAGYDEDLQMQVLDAVEAALEKALSAEVLVSLSPNNQIYSGYYGKYEFDEAPEVTLSCGIKDAEIYYYVTDSYTTENPDTATWTLYEGAFKPTFSNEEGGTVYIQLASTRDGGETWLNTKQISITYKEKPDENAFMIGETGYSSFAKALAAVAEGEEIVLNQDLSLDGTVTMPSVSFSITSAEGECYKVESNNALELNGDLEISNVDWRATTYLNGHDFTAGEDVYQNTWRFSYTKLYAGSKTGSIEADPTITISSGQFDVYGCAEDAELTGTVTISVDGTAMVNIIGAGSGSTLNGSLDVTINGDDGAMLSSFIGRKYSAEVSGDLTLTLEGAVQLAAWGGTYQTIEYDSSASWGTLDLTNADLSDDDKERFEGFANVLSADDDQSENTVAVIDDTVQNIDNTTSNAKDTTVDDEITDEDQTAKDQKSDETADNASKDEETEETDEDASKDETTEDTDKDASKDETTEDTEKDTSKEETTEDTEEDTSKDETTEDTDKDTSKDEETKDTEEDASKNEDAEESEEDASKDEDAEGSADDVSNDEETKESDRNASNDENSSGSGSDDSEAQGSEKSSEGSDEDISEERQ